MRLFKRLLEIVENIGRHERIHWLEPKDTFSDVLKAYPLNRVKEGDSVFLIREHECGCCEGNYDSHWDQSVGMYEEDHEAETDHGMGNTRYKAVVINGAWTRVKIPWRNY